MLKMVGESGFSCLDAACGFTDGEERPFCQLFAQAHNLAQDRVQWNKDVCSRLSFLPLHSSDLLKWKETFNEIGRRQWKSILLHTLALQRCNPTHVAKKAARCKGSIH